MIHLKFLIFFFWWANHAQALECTLNGTSCTFSDVRTSKSDLYFKPSATNNNAVEKVSFENSVMHTLTDELCKAFPNLKELTVKDASMEQIAPKALNECKKVTMVYFYGNKLEHLDSNIFEGNPELLWINLENNRLEEIDGKMFQPVRDLFRLAISENFIHELSLEQFPVLENLDELYIYSNSLRDLDEQQLLRKFPNLGVIYMHNNLFDCGRLRIIIDALRKEKVRIREWDKHLQTRHTNLTTIENVECISDPVVELKKKNVYMIVAIGVLGGLVFVMSVVLLIIVYKFKTFPKPVNKNRDSDYYYEDTGFGQEKSCCGT